MTRLWQGQPFEFLPLTISRLFFSLIFPILIPLLTDQLFLLYLNCSILSISRDMQCFSQPLYLLDKGSGKPASSLTQDLFLPNHDPYNSPYPTFVNPVHQ